MSGAIENMFGNRIKLARKMAGMSLQELSDALGNKVTKQALNKYEMGLMNPTNEVLMALSKTLKLNPEYFLKKDQVELGTVQFRKKTSLAKKNEEAIIERTRDYVERHLEIEAILSIDSNFQNPLINLQIKSKEDVELAANQLRQLWELGTSPIPNIVEMLELKGIKVLLIDDSEEIDGFAVFSSNGIPIVLVNTKSKPIERIRFTIIHELAHLLLQLDKNIQSDERGVEKMCHYFASCFLIPRKMLIEMIGSPKRNYIEIKELIGIKEYYGISIRAIVHRLEELEVISVSYYKSWVVYMSKTYGSKNEPGQYIGSEKSKVFDQLINRALAEGLISLSKAAYLWNVNIGELRKEFVSAS